MNKGQESPSDITSQINALKIQQPTLSHTDTTADVTVTSDDDPVKKFSVEDIISKNIDKMETFLNSKVINIYKRPWNKLEPKLKIIKIKQYLCDIDTSSEKNITLDTCRHILMGLNSTKKKLKVEYDVENCMIESLKIV